ncbi:MULTISPECIES: ABC transporter ATP-binding protein [Streptococcus]|uniref:ABC transporter ATP-binding protein n=1 Tax=Streptococcus caledonicus TaxID=2614158 RepID=A0ABW0UAS0_9STRE|nr:ABC transporter ATP-binding protein [Streptococcus sp. S784/96/1]
MAIISFDNVSFRQQGKTILKNINWQVESGQTWAILGLNGSGKTTLLKLIMAEHWPSHGQISILDKSFGQEDMTSIRNRIGVVGSFISERLPKNMLAEKIVLTGKYKSSILYKAYGEVELNEARHMLLSLGGEHLLGRIYASLSQGEKQLLLIARSLMENPDIIILDEATSGLDLFAREQLLAQIGKISQLPHAPTVIYVTHHAEEITKQMSHVLLLRQGKIIAQGKKKDILKEDTLSTFYQNPVTIIPIDEDRVYVHPKHL